MKSILPVKIRLNGSQVLAHYLQCVGTYDDFINTWTVCYAQWSKFIDANEIETPAEQLETGFVSVSGNNYQDKNKLIGSSINDWIYNYVANEINVIII